MTIRNEGPIADRLIRVESDIARRIELHRHVAGDDGVIEMRPVPDGFDIPAGGSRELARGGDHVMLMGLDRNLVDGETVPMTLVFERAGAVAVEVVADSARTK